MTISTAESCTSGSLATILTSFPGSSDYFEGGIIAYSNKVKINQLGVSVDDIQKYSAVCEKVAKQMAEGVRANLKTDYAIATTGYAGPKGERVGQVFVALASSKKTIIKEYFFKGNRKEIIYKAVCETLAILLREIKN
ncbi:MAG: CinA family protein [Flavobacteriales bacterium]|nr:CinA family protein [Flavobacteriales bacterium]